MSNFFAMLDTSDDENDKPAVVAKKSSGSGGKKQQQQPQAAKEIVEPSKKVPGPKDRKGDRPSREGGSGGNTKTKGGREFERKSGTGRGKEVSKGGAGGNNWGNSKSAAADEAAAAAAGSEEAEEGDKAAREEVEENTISYEEYLAAKQAEDDAKAALEGFGALKPKEIESEFKVQPKVNELEDFLVMGAGKGLRKKGGEKKEKVVVESAFRFKAPEREGEGGGRGGGRGSGRGDGDRRGGRGGDRRPREPGVGKSFAEGGRGQRSGFPADRRAPGAGRGGKGGRGIDVASPEMFPALG